MKHSLQKSKIFLNATHIYIPTVYLTHFLYIRLTDIPRKALIMVGQDVRLPWNSGNQWVSSELQDIILFDHCKEINDGVIDTVHFLLND